MKIKKALLVLLSLFFVVICSATVKAEDEENLVINGKEIKYYNTNDNVTIPTSYYDNDNYMRGMWIQTVWNGDIFQTNSVQSFKNNYLSILDTLEEYNFNTVFFQIRPNNDAFYVSELNPWSRWMTGVQGKPLMENGEVFDPLEWIIEVTHERGMQLIGWMNAYRVSYSTLFSGSSNSNSKTQVDNAVTRTLNSLAKENYARLHPEYVLLGDTDAKLILNPGEPNVQRFLTNTITEIVTKYDIDGVHFDDYFYLDSTNSAAAEVAVNSEAQYMNADTAFNDYYNDFQTYIKYRNSNSETLADFRRRSVNNMIKSISNAIDQVNEQYGKNVQFGSKPAGVWTSAGRSVAGRLEGANVNTYAYSSYSDIFADSLYWAEQGWIDWIAPQVYYNFDNNDVPYADIVSWWAQAIKKTNEDLTNQGKKAVKLYIAHGFYRMDPSDTSGKQITDSTEIKKQLLFNSKFDSLCGSAFYDFKTFKKEVSSIKVARQLIKEMWSEKTLPYTTTDSQVAIQDAKLENNVITIKKQDNVRLYLIYKDNQLFDTKANSDAVDGNITINVEAGSYSIVAVDKNYAISSNIYKLDGVNYEYVKLYQGDTYQIEGTNYNYQTNDVFTLDNNVITALNDGTVVLEATDGSKRLIIEVIGKYNLSLDANGGSVDSPVSYFTADQELVLPIPERVGYKFLGWYDSDDKKVTTTKNIKNDLALTAKWERLTRYKVSVNEDPSFTIETNYPLNRVYEGYDLTIKIVPAAGYTAKDAVLTINGQAVQLTDLSYTIKNVSAEITIEVSGLKLATYNVTFDINGEQTTITCNGKVENPPVPKAKEGYEFVGWSHSLDNITEDIVVTAIFAKLKYEVTLQYGENEETLTVLYGENIELPVVDGYTIEWDHDGKDIKQNITIKGVLYNTVTIVVDGTKTTSQIETNKALVLEAPTKEGFDFVGWYFDEAFTTAVADNYKVDSNITVYAKFVEKVVEEPKSNCNSATIIRSIALIALGLMLIRRRKW